MGNTSKPKKPGGINRYEDIERVVRAVGEAFEQAMKLPRSRPAAMALTKLDEARLWLGELAAARHLGEPIEEVPRG